MIRCSNLCVPISLQEILDVIDWNVVSVQAHVWIGGNSSLAESCYKRQRNRKAEQEKNYGQLSLLGRTCLYRTWLLSAKDKRLRRLHHAPLLLH